MTLNVDKEKCIGCGACVALSNELFDFDENGLAYAKKIELTKELEKVTVEAIENCPTEAIVKKEL